MSAAAGGARRTIVVGAGIAIALVAAAWLLFDRYVRERPADPVPPPLVVAADERPTEVDAGASIEAPPQARVVAVEGEVERSADPDDADPRNRAWTKVSVGELLGEHERLRTSRGGTAELSIGAASSIVVSEATEVGVVELSQAVQRFKLVKGRVTADALPGGKRTLRIEGEQGQQASSEDGRFSVLATGNAFTVASERGTVNLTSAGKVVTVEAGRQASVMRGSAPAAAAPVPVDVLLLAAGRLGGCSEIHGTAAVGSEVLVDDVLAPVDARGRFRVRLKRVHGRASVTVRTRDAAGHVVERVVKCASAPKESEVDGIAIKRWHKRRK